MALDPALASIVVIQWWSTLSGAKCAFHTSFQKYQQRGSFRHRIYEGQFMPGKIARGDSSFWPISSLLKSRETTDWLSFRCLPSFLFSATTATFTLERFYSHKVRKYLAYNSGNLAAAVLCPDCNQKEGEKSKVALKEKRAISTIVRNRLHFYHWEMIEMRNNRLSTTTTVEPTFGKPSLIGLTQALLPQEDFHCRHSKSSNTINCENLDNTRHTCFYAS